MGKVIYREDVGEIEFKLYEDFIKYLNRLDDFKIECKPHIPFVRSIKVKEKLIDIIRLQLGITDDSDVKLTDNLVKHLGADSLDLIEIVMAAEEEFNLDISDFDAEKITTVGEAINYINRRLGNDVAPKYQPNEHGYIPPDCAWPDDLPKYFMWRAVDADGDVYYYSGALPYALKNTWDCDDGDNYVHDEDDYEELTIDWTKTLTKRPEGV